MPRILIDCDKYKNPYTGLWSFIGSLTDELGRQAPKNKGEIYVLLKNKFRGHLGSNVHYRPIKFYNKNFLYLSKKTNVFHQLFQEGKYFPTNKKHKVLLTIHDLNCLYEKNSKRISNSLQIIQNNVNRADAIVTISDFVKNDVLKNLDTRGKKITTIYNGCRPFTTILKNTLIPYKPQQEFLFTIGTVLEKKNFHTLPCLLHNNKMELIIAGKSSSYNKRIEREAKRWNVLNRVKLIGTLSEEQKYWYLQNCKAFVFPSLAEGFGLPIIEAMQYGKPLFLSKRTCVPEIGGKDSFYFNDDFDPELMQKELIDGLSIFDEKQSNRLSERAKQFSLEKTAEKYWDQYKQLIKSDVNYNLDKHKKKNTLSIIIIMYNEIENVKEIMDNVLWADEVIVVDSFSNDGTYELLKEYPIKLYQRKFESAADQKNWTIKKAKCNWIFVLDADERITEPLKKEIQNTIAYCSNTAFSIPRKNYFLGSRIKYSGWQTDSVIRLFENDNIFFKNVLVHESVLTSKNIINLNNPILHYTCKDLKVYKNKINNYAERRALQKIKNNQKLYLITTCYKAIYKFLFNYILRGGFLDGKNGYLICSIRYTEVFLTYSFYKKYKKQRSRKSI